MPRAIWNGVISFGLLNIPVALQSGERSTDLHFRMLDSRDHARIRFERVNADTGEEVPWKQIVKAFEYQKGNYVVLDDKDFERAAPESHEAVEIEAFVSRDEINPMYFEKPYYLVPGKRAEKGYVLLREVLARQERIAIARVVIRTREHLSAVMPLGNALVLLLLRFPQELVKPETYTLPDKRLSDYRVTPTEIKAAEQLVESMTVPFDPDQYVDDFRRRLREAIDKRIDADETVQPPDEEDEEPPARGGNVVDFMSLLRKSLDGRKGAGDSGPKSSADDEKRPGADAKSAGRSAAKAGGKAGTKSGKRSAPKSTSRSHAKSGTKSASQSTARSTSKPATKRQPPTPTRATGSKSGGTPRKSAATTPRTRRAA